LSTSIDQAFIKQFEEEVHQAYQRMGSKLRNTVRVKNGVRGSSTVFQTVGKGSASTKARHGMVPVMNIDHTPVECQLQDFYAGDWVDHLDELKVNIDERQVLANAGAFALGRKTDEMIITALGQTANTAGTGGDGLTKAKVLEAFELLGEKDVPDDGQRYAVIGWKQWSDLLEINEFASADFVGPDELPWRGTQAKRWLGTLWLPHSGLELNASVRRCFWYHRSAIGHAIGQEVTSDITWHGDRAAHFVSNSMSQGACLIDGQGVVEMPSLES
jgi:Phage capsid protein